MTDNSTLFLQQNQPEVLRFMSSCMERVGAPPSSASRLALNLAAADLRGHFSHGLSRLAHYVADVRAGTCDPAARPRVEKESAAAALVDGRNGLGVVVGEFW